jgi:hypothetical protein
LLTDDTQGQECNVTPSHSVTPLLALDCQVESGSRDNDEGNTGHPDRATERQSEDVHDEGQWWLSKYEGVPATTVTHGNHFAAVSK